MKKNKLIYIVGAGRSGTTALATFLNGSENIICLGELHHLPEYVDDNLHCSCGEVLDQCTFWSALNVKKLGFTTIFSIDTVRVVYQKKDMTYYFAYYLQKNTK